MAYWLFKSEPESYSIDDLIRDGTTPWSGVRNYQARNLMREMRVGERGFFYHSSTKPPGIVGIVRIVREAYPDRTAVDATSAYFDPKATDEKPIWENVDVTCERAFARLISLAELRGRPELAGMTLLARGSRLSVQPVAAEQYAAILRLAEEPSEERAHVAREKRPFESVRHDGRDEKRADDREHVGERLR